MCCFKLNKTHFVLLFLGGSSLVLFLFSDYQYVFAFEDPEPHWLHLYCAIRHSKLPVFVGRCSKALVCQHVSGP